MSRQTCTRFLLSFALVAAVVACTPTPSQPTVVAGTPAPSKPKVVIHSPASGSEFRDGEQVEVRSTSTDPTGIVRVELDVDNVTTRTDRAPTPRGESPFTLIQTWKATPGDHTLRVRAFNASGEESEPVGVKISVRQAARLEPASTDTPSPVSQPPTSTPKPSGCNDNSAFVTDVSVPDGTALAPSQVFNKTWRLRNNGTCAWGAGYQLVFVSGEAMATTTAVVVPETAPGATADLLVAMTAPSASGTHTGYWRLRNASAAAFGTQVSVKINVVSNAPPSQQPAQQPAASCTGTPNIGSFTANPAGFALLGGDSTLSWGAVTNADSVEIDNGIGGVATPGSTTVHVIGTTTYTLTAHCGSNTKTAQVTITVQTLIFQVTPILPPLISKVTAVNATKGAIAVCAADHKATITFYGTITAAGVTDATYRWEDSNGPVGATQTLHFTTAGTLGVQSYIRSGYDTGTMTIHVLTPNDMKSNAVSFAMCP